MLTKNKGEGFMKDLFMSLLCKDGSRKWPVKELCMGLLHQLKNFVANYGIHLGACLYQVLQLKSYYIHITINRAVEQV